MPPCRQRRLRGRYHRQLGMRQTFAPSTCRTRIRCHHDAATVIPAQRRRRVLPDPAIGLAIGYWRRRESRSGSLVVFHWVKAILSNFGINWSLYANQNCSARTQAGTIESKGLHPIPLNLLKSAIDFPLVTPMFRLRLARTDWPPPISHKIHLFELWRGYERWAVRF